MTSKTHSSRPVPPLGKLAAFALLLACFSLLVWITNAAIQRPPSFDGAMNLQVSWSLARGEGYRRTYAQQDPFPREVQTNVPFTVPAAISLAALGTGTAQSQMANLAYLYLLVILSFLIVQSRFGALAGAITALAVVMTPGIFQFGLNGYGEVPALAWSLAAVLAFPWRGGSANRRRFYLAGLFLGLSLTTKTVMAICVAVFGFGFLLSIAFYSSRTARERFTDMLILLGGVASPLVLIEFWRLRALGDLSSYHAWWLAELGAIGKQAGATDGYQDTAGLTAKVSTHLDHLSDMFGFAPMALLVWIAAPTIFSLGLIAKRVSLAKSLPFLCLAGAATLYLAWWLGFTPSQKAWHRRVLDGTILLNICWVYMAAWVATGSKKAISGRAYIGAFAPLGLVLGTLLTIHGPMLWKALQRSEDSAEHFEQAVSTLRSLPHDAQVFGVGWNSAPALSLFAERPLADFNDAVVQDLDPSIPTYVIVDSATASVFTRESIVGAYQGIPLLPRDSRKQIYKLDLMMSFPEARNVGSHVRAHAVSLADVAYPVITGFHGAEGSGRWMSTDAAIRLRYDGQRRFAIRLYSLPQSKYTWGRQLSLTAKVGGCPAREVLLPRPGLQTLEFEIPDNCELPPGQPTTVRLSTNNVLDSSITRDDRSMAMVVSEAGFTDKCISDTCDRFVSLRKENKQPVGNQTVSARRPSNAFIVLTPSSITDCPLDGTLPSVEVSWSAPDAAQEGVSIWVSAPTTAEKLWASSTRTTGSGTTGPWIRNGTTFRLSDHTGRSLAPVVTASSDCDQ